MTSLTHAEEMALFRAHPPEGMTRQEQIEALIASRCALAWEQGRAAGLNDAQLGEDDDGYAPNPYISDP